MSETEQLIRIAVSIAAFGVFTGTVLRWANRHPR